jgi:outer membrane murein-binding lipoprotein Lpp
MKKFFLLMLIVSFMLLPGCSKQNTEPAKDQTSKNIYNPDKIEQMAKDMEDMKKSNAELKDQLAKMKTEKEEMEKQTDKTKIKTGTPAVTPSASLSPTSDKSNNNVNLLVENKVLKNKVDDLAKKNKNLENKTEKYKDESKEAKKDVEKYKKVRDSAYVSDGKEHAIKDITDLRITLDDNSVWLVYPNSTDLYQWRELDDVFITKTRDWSHRDYPYIIRNKDSEETVFAKYMGIEND